MCGSRRVQGAGRAFQKGKHRGVLETHRQYRKEAHADSDVTGQLCNWRLETF